MRSCPRAGREEASRRGAELGLSPPAAFVVVWGGFLFQAHPKERHSPPHLLLEPLQAQRAPRRLLRRAGEASGRAAAAAHALASAHGLFRGKKRCLGFFLPPGGSAFSEDWKGRAVCSPLHWFGGEAVGVPGDGPAETRRVTAAESSASGCAGVQGGQRTEEGRGGRGGSVRRRAGREHGPQNVAKGQKAPGAHVPTQSADPVPWAGEGSAQPHGAELQAELVWGLLCSSKHQSLPVPRAAMQRLPGQAPATP